MTEPEMVWKIKGERGREREPKLYLIKVLSRTRVERREEEEDKRRKSEPETYVLEEWCVCLSIYMPGGASDI